MYVFKQLQCLNIQATMYVMPFLLPPSFLSQHRSAKTLCWFWYIVVVSLISIFMRSMCMRLNYKMVSISFNKIKLAQEFKEYVDGKNNQKDTS